MVFNKYDALKTETLLRVVQEQVRQLKDKKRKPKKTKAFIEAMKERREMQYTLIKRFKDSSKICIHNPPNFLLIIPQI